MLNEYINETAIPMNVKLMAQEIRNFTSGYPYLVSRLCKNIDEYIGKEWKVEGLQESIKMTLNEHNTLFDNVIKNLENYEEIKNIVNEILVEGKQISYNPFAYKNWNSFVVLSFVWRLKEKMLVVLIRC